MRRGEIRIIHSRVSGRDQHALIIGNDALNESSSTGWIILAPIDTSGATPDLLVTVRITSPINGIIRLDNVTSVRKDRMGDLIGRIDPGTMEHVNAALRATLDLLPVGWSRAGSCRRLSDGPNPIPGRRQIVFR